MPVYDLYGSRDLRPDQAEAAVGRALGIIFEAHESSYWGEYYFYGHGLPGGEHLEIKPSHDAEGELIEPDFEEFSTLVYVNETLRSDDIRRALREVNGVDLLRSEVLPS